MKRFIYSLEIAVTICSPLAAAPSSTIPSEADVSLTFGNELTFISSETKDDSLVSESETYVTSNDTACAILRFEELPFIEGKLYISVTCGDNNILLSATDVESETVTLPINLSDYVGKEIDIKAFQDLDDNHKLDFDSYGRPTEPCLQTKVTVESKEGIIPLNLIQY